MKYEQHVESYMQKYPEADRSIVEEVNRRIDQFAHYPNPETLAGHRKFLHHLEGAEYFEKVYGYEGRRAALEHIIQDCGAVPSMEDYALGFVDMYGHRAYNLT